MICLSNLMTDQEILGAMHGCQSSVFRVLVDRLQTRHYQLVDIRKLCKGPARDDLVARILELTDLEP